MKQDRKKILVAMSGGVDSSVTAALLVEEGHEVVGATMRTFCSRETPSHPKTCCGLEGIMDARAVAKRLGIVHHIFDVEEEFTRDVIDDFVSEYARGRTPNPCVQCNSNTKFRDLMRRGRELGCDGIATGHYVRMVRTPGAEPALLRGVDRAKDQAYFLWGLPPELVRLLHFPLGGLTKPQVRERARELQLATAEKPESQEICFVPMGDYRQVLEKRLAPRHPALEPGPIVNRTGEVLGEHDGYAGFTVGQRKGLGGGFSEPLFVLEVRPENREVVVGTKDELFSPGMDVEGVNWLTATPPRPGQEVKVQIRHRAPSVPAVLQGVDPASDAIRFRFREPQRAVTPGQSAAIFQGERLLGGGRIAAALSGAEGEERDRSAVLQGTS
jgi:tRNA-uridine 2-sulfurtransferase